MSSVNISSPLILFSVVLALAVLEIVVLVLLTLVLSISPVLFSICGRGMISIHPLLI